MASRESSLGENFDPAAFHRTVAMTQSGWAEHEIRRGRTSGRRALERFASLITFGLGALLVAALRPPDVMDARDLVVTSVALAGCLVAGMVGSRMISALAETSVEFDRIALWGIAATLGMIVAATGTVATMSRDADDYIVDLPGYTMTSSPELKNVRLVGTESGLFSDVGLWSLQSGDVAAGSIGVYLIADESSVSSVGDRKFISQALNQPAAGVNAQRLAGRNVFVVSSAGKTQIGWVERSAVLVVSGGDRRTVESTAGALIRESR